MRKHLAAVFIIGFAILFHASYVISLVSKASKESEQAQTKSPEDIRREQAAIANIAGRQVTPQQQESAEEHMRRNQEIADQFAAESEARVQQLEDQAGVPRGTAPRGSSMGTDIRDNTHIYHGSGAAPASPSGSGSYSSKNHARQDGVHRFGHGVTVGNGH